jgi:hypothetical protein
MVAAVICAASVAFWFNGGALFRWVVPAGALGGEPAQDVADRIGLPLAQGAGAGPVDDDPLFVGDGSFSLIRYGRPVRGPWTLGLCRWVKSWMTFVSGY